MRVLMTPDCFKRLCMRSRGKKAEEVRTYFIQIEALVLKYKDHMVAGMQAEIERLELHDRGVHIRSARVRPHGQRLQDRTDEGLEKEAA